ncbi:hypothetical protein [Bowmanella pacifica]|uniref:Uncharacterized protein n=1 Tax=Bowmanella pacifica TaxID=502051 RepID=A0A918DK54_9ALTE|nr:hypothetical protein [Bowmanella pacifica]GGO71567.1 hypothetical protein GCM10010982_27650 [Bowmanella pacifica]
MNKEWNLTLNDQLIRITNSWFHGMKLYINGELKDHDRRLFALGNLVTLSAKLDDGSVLEVEPKAIFTVEIKVYLTKDSERSAVFSSSDRLPLSQQRTLRQSK